MQQRNAENQPSQKRQAHLTNVVLEFLKSENAYRTNIQRMCQHFLDEEGKVKDDCGLPDKLKEDTQIKYNIEKYLMPYSKLQHNPFNEVIFQPDIKELISLIHSDQSKTLIREKANSIKEKYKAQLPAEVMNSYSDVFDKLVDDQLSLDEFHQEMYRITYQNGAVLTDIILEKMRVVYESQEYADSLKYTSDVVNNLLEANIFFRKLNNDGLRFVGDEENQLDITSYLIQPTRRLTHEKLLAQEMKNQTAANMSNSTVAQSLVDITAKNEDTINTNKDFFDIENFFENLPINKAKSHTYKLLTFKETAVGRNVAKLMRYAEKYPDRTKEILWEFAVDRTQKSIVYYNRKIHGNTPKKSEKKPPTKNNHGRFSGFKAILKKFTYQPPYQERLNFFEKADEILKQVENGELSYDVAISSLTAIKTEANQSKHKLVCEELRNILGALETIVQIQKLTIGPKRPIVPSHLQTEIGKIQREQQKINQQRSDNIKEQSEKLFEKSQGKTLEREKTFILPKNKNQPTENVSPKMTASYFDEQSTKASDIERILAKERAKEKIPEVKEQNTKGLSKLSLIAKKVVAGGVKIVSGGINMMKSPIRFFKVKIGQHRELKREIKIGQHREFRATTMQENLNHLKKRNTK